MESAVRRDKKKTQHAYDTKLDALNKALTAAKEALWLYEKFGDGFYVDVPGLCRIASTDEIASKDWSLTPGAYVGVVPMEDDGVVFTERMEEIHRELLALQAESNNLMDTLSRNMQELNL